MANPRITAGPYTAKPTPGMVMVAGFGLGAYVMAPAGTPMGDPQDTAEFFCNAANAVAGQSLVPHSHIETAMALWEAVLDQVARDNKAGLATKLTEAMENHGCSDMRRMTGELIPACEDAWSTVNDTFLSWDWEMLPLVVGLWVDADCTASAVTADKIVAAVRAEEARLHEANRAPSKPASEPATPDPVEPIPVAPGCDPSDKMVQEVWITIRLKGQMQAALDANAIAGRVLEACSAHFTGDDRGTGFETVIHGDVIEVEEEAQIYGNE